MNVFKYLYERVAAAEPESTPETGSGSLGLVQVAVLHVIETMPDRAFGTGIAAELSKRIGDDLPDAQVFTALRRLEHRKLIRAAEIAPNASVTPSKRSRGRPRRYYSLTLAGRRALHGAAAIINHGGKLRQHGGVGEKQEEKDGWLAPTAVLG